MTFNHEWTKEKIVDSTHFISFFLKWNGQGRGSPLGCFNGDAGSLTALSLQGAWQDPSMPTQMKAEAAPLTRWADVGRWAFWDGRGSVPNVPGRSWMHLDHWVSCLGGWYPCFDLPPFAIPCSAHRTSETILCLRVTAPTRCDRHDRWFQTFFIFTLTWGNDPIWLIFFRWVETTNQLL